jgi:CIC family chloride channel protein
LAGRLRTFARLRRLYLLRAEIRLAPTEAQRLTLLTAAIGVVCGLAAVAFHLTIRAATAMAVTRAMNAPGHVWMWATIAVPTLGAIAAGVLLTYVAPNARGSGIPQVKVAFAVRGARLRLRDSVAKFGIGALQIGCGASLGREGPTVQICAGLASALGRALRVPAPSLRRLLPVGAAAGIAAAFNAPIAAVTFTTEEIVGNLDQTLLSGVVVAAALAAVIERSILGEHPVVDVPETHGLPHASSLLVCVGLGLAAAAVALAFTDSLLWLRARMRRPGGVPAWLRPGLGGAVTGVLAVVALGALGARGITGGGYETLGVALAGGLSAKVMLALCAMKLVATVCSYSSGGAGGIFAPTLFIGAMLGAAFGSADATFLGHSAAESVPTFALVGMGAVFAGIIRAPITSVLIIVEMTGGYSLILPLMIANTIAYTLARQRRPTPIYEALLEQDGFHLPDRVLLESLETIPLERLVRSQPFRSFSLAAPAAELVRRPPGAPDQRVFPVLDPSRRLIGIITSDDLAALAAEPEVWALVNAADLMRPRAAANREDHLRAALEAMIEHAITELPIVDAEGGVVGFVDEASIANAYLRHLTTASARG